MEWTTKWDFGHGKYTQASFMCPLLILTRRWLFIIEGAITIVVAFSSVFILPNFPRTTPWLTEEEKQLAAWRLEEDIGEDDWVDSEQQTFLHGVKLAFTDIKTYLLVSQPTVEPNPSAHSIANELRCFLFSELSPLPRLPISSPLL